MGIFPPSSKASHKTKHSIHCRQTSPQCQRGKGVYFIVLATVPVLWKCPFLKRWIAGFSLLVVKLCCLVWHTLRVSTNKVDLTLQVCAWWVLVHGISSENGWLWMCTDRCLSPITMLPIVRLEAALSDIQQKVPFQMFAQSRYTAFPLEWGIASSAETKRE